MKRNVGVLLESPNESATTHEFDHPCSIVFRAIIGNVICAAYNAEGAELFNETVNERFETGQILDVKRISTRTRGSGGHTAFVEIS